MVGMENLGSLIWTKFQLIQSMKEKSVVGVHKLITLDLVHIIVVVIVIIILMVMVFTMV